MFCNIYYVLIIAIIHGSVHCIQKNDVFMKNTIKRNFIYNKYKYDAIINLIVNDTTEQILEFYEETDHWNGYPTRVHASTNDTINGDYPLFITATQQKGVSSWELPLVVQTSSAVMQFDDMARTLCPHDAGPNMTTENRPLIHITTANPKNVSVGIKLRRVQDFYVELNKEVNMNVTPSTPKYYYFSFDNNPWNVTGHGQRSGFLPRFNYTVPKSVILIIESDDDLCAIVSIQNNSCPVFDNEKDVLYQGYHLTMTTKGGITLTQSVFPVGFYIVFIVKQSDEECTGVSETENNAWGTWEERFALPAVGADGRVKSFRFRVIATISYKEYVVAALVALALVLALYALVALLACLRCQWTEEVLIIEEAPGPSTSGSRSEAADCEDTKPIMRRGEGDAGGAGDAEDADESLSESEREQEREQPPPRLTLAGLSRARPAAHCRRSDRYFWSVLTVAVVYALPVVQLLFTYQHMVFQTGEQDLCYYNFLCAHPLGFLSDFNHVYSNVGYVVLGLVFLMQTRARQVATRGRPLGLGIPQHHGLFYSMGLALAMEGLLSGCYHLCPNKMNFQFDSSFMYVMAVLVMVKLYQNRHPDVNASAHATFMLIAVIMAIGVFGIMYPSVYFWTFFTILHLGTCFVLTLKIYYVGQFKFERAAARGAWAALRRGGRRALRPRYPARAALLALAAAANGALAAYGLYEHNRDFARHLLAILMGNAILYTLFYVVMKLLHRERLLLHTWLYLVFAHVAWFTALRLFLDSKTKWSQTPAQSRRHNAVCSALQFYDSHDVWHVASAAALFLSLNMLLTVDDALAATPRHHIPVF